jgi:hypothetical protein
MLSWPSNAVSRVDPFPPGASIPAGDTMCWAASLYAAAAPPVAAAPVAYARQSYPVMGGGELPTRSGRAPPTMAPAVRCCRRAWQGTCPFPSACPCLCAFLPWVHVPDGSSRPPEGRCMPMVCCPLCPRCVFLSVLGVTRASLGEVASKAGPKWQRAALVVGWGSGCICGWQQGSPLEHEAGVQLIVWPDCQARATPSSAAIGQNVCGCGCGGSGGDEGTARVACAVTGHSAVC